MPIISLGSWCRPAWQIRRITGGETAMPYDWQITSFRALLSTLDPGYNAQTALDIDNIVVNQFSSVTDLSSGWVYQHDLHVSNFNLENGAIIHDDRAQSVITASRNKYAFLIDRFREVCGIGGITFIRWIRSGHPDGEWPEAFEGEDPEQLHEALLRISPNPTLVYVRSIEDYSGTGDSSFETRSLEWGNSVVLTEDARKFNAENWTGDSDAWSRFIQSLID